MPLTYQLLTRQIYNISISEYSVERHWFKILFLSFLDRWFIPQHFHFQSKVNWYCMVYHLGLWWICLKISSCFTYTLKFSLSLLRIEVCLWFPQKHWLVCLFVWPLNITWASFSTVTLVAFQGSYKILGRNCVSINYYHWTVAISW